MIIVRLLGGLGNQMFQFAAGYSLAKRLGVEVKLDTSYLLAHNLQGKNIVKRFFDLDIFDYQFDIASKLEVRRHVYWGKTNRINDFFHRIIKKNNNVYLQPHTDYDKICEQLQSPKYIIGYFQSYKYFINVVDEVRDIFTSFKQPLLDQGLSLKNEITELNSVCLNVRRTDFLKSAVHGVCSLKYYEKAVEHLSSIVGNIHIFVFADDIEWCKENLKFKYKTTFVDHSYAGQKFRDYFELMIACRHFIIPNSSFAWWAAWLGSDRDKIVVAPKKWYALEEYNTNDIYQSEWILI